MTRSIRFVLFVGLVACGGNQAAPQAPATPASEPHAEGHSGDDHHATKAAGPVKAPGEASVGDTTKCPVSGEEFVVDATSPKAEHAGKTYYFCCAGCKKKFEASPEKYLHQS